jgi:hypothetical protein
MSLIRITPAFCAAVAAMLFGPAQAARAEEPDSPPSFTFTDINFPNAVNTYVFGVGPNDSLVGSFFDDSGTLHGFVETKNGSFKQFDLKGIKGLAGSAIQAKTAAGTLAQAYVNISSGQIVVSYFINPNGKYTLISVPKSKQTWGWSMNASGTIVGSFLAADNATTEAFIYQGGKYTTFKQPGMSYTSYNGINDKGVIVGDYQAQSGADLEVGFILTNGTMKTAEHPNVTATIFQGINNAGEVVGYVRDFFNRSNEGFVYKGGKFTDVGIGPATYDWAWAIDSKGNIYGADINADENVSGFVGTLK